ncbi:uncharacterized protein LOC129218746 [Uloborus diversus]|uniref:uncharacterized protein LOC129218746 n=1 Tax=Uloborus diversus TaxID=327109 RepID=UPI00240A5F96|nr:uncharacterized protein LOC129218746 [Uloborus diversus]
MENILPPRTNMVDAAIQTESFSEIIDKISEQQREIESLKRLLGETKFVPENIFDDVKMRALTSFSRERFFMLFSFLNIQKDLEKNSSLSPVHLFFLFLVKLRTGITNEFLSILFNISDSTVSRYFNFVVGVLHTKLGTLKIFPDKAMVHDSMPRNFLKENSECRIIIDCTEFPIQKPNSPSEQQMTFSHYKNKNTLKGLIGIMPSGAISFISDLYCGSISDKEIFLKSGLLNLLEQGDVVMADKGFLIEKELLKKGCHLKQPIFLKDKIQFEANEMVDNCKLSNKRVTVERAISRIKQYKYFEGSIPYTALHSANSVFFVTCMLSNFHDPLIKKG